jgi:hypothetical protein
MPTAAANPIALTHRHVGSATESARAGPAFSGLEALGSLSRISLLAQDLEPNGRPIGIRVETSL